jgi:hypothetical protein
MYTQLNRADVEKDARESPSISVKNALYNICANTLFGTLNADYRKIFEFVDKEIEKRSCIHKCSIYPKTRISTLRHPLDEYTLFLPERVSYAIQDSGLSPSDFGKFVYLITPASYIDSAPRSSHSTLLFGFDKYIPKSVFTKMLGISHIETLKSSIDKSNMVCNVNITCVFDNRMHNINTTFNNSMTPIHGDIEFFKGNATKNTWFQTAGEYAPTNALYDTGCKYLLCKVIGDILQSYYGKEFERTLPDGHNRVCLFTYDKVLATRCRILQLPVVLKDYNSLEKELHECIYYPSPGIVDHDIKDMFCQFVISHNKSVIQTIQYAINSQNILFGDTHYIMNPKIVQYIISFIQSATSKVQCAIDAECMTIPEYRNEINKYLANHLFTKSDIYYFIRKDETHICEGFPGLGHAKNIGELLQSNMSGGAITDEDILPTELYEAAFDDVPYTDKTDMTNLMLDATYDVQLRRRIYLLLLHSYPDSKKSSLVLQTEDIFNYLYRRFLCVGGFLLNMQFLSEFVIMYIKGGNSALYMVSPQEFEHKYELWKSSNIISNHHENDYDSTPSFSKTMIAVRGGKTRKKTRRRHRK